MTVIARLDNPGLAVEPGEVAVVDITVQNSGRRVEAYQIDLVGEPAAWATVSPAELSVYPGDEAHAQVTFSPPRDAAVHAGSRAYGVRVRPVEHPEQAVVPEGIIDLRPFADMTMELTPRTSHGRGRGRHEVALDNRGNTPIPVELHGDDPDDEVGVKVSPAMMIVGPGEAAFARVRVRPTRRRWTGTPVSHPFQVVAIPEGSPALASAGNMYETPVLPRGTGKVLATVAALGLLAAGIWFGLLRPVVRSAAQDAVAAPVAQVQQQAKTADQKAAAAQVQASKANGTAGEINTKLVQKGVLKPGDVKSAPADPASTPVQTSAPPKAAPAAPLAAPFDQRMTTTVAATATGSQTITVQPKQTLSITDLVYENPQGDTGTLTVKIDDKVLFIKGLANFRDMTEHYQSPIVVTAGEKLVLEVQCGTPGKPATSCNTALIVLGGLAINKS